MSHRARIAGLCAVLGVTLTACVAPQEPGVKVRLLATHVGLGILKPPTPGAFAGLPGFPPPGDDGSSGRPGEPWYPPPAVKCPVAGAMEFPEKAPAAPDRDSAPVEGDYPWHYDLTINDPAVAQRYTATPLAGLPVGRPIRFGGKRTVYQVAPDIVEAAQGAQPPDPLPTRQPLPEGYGIDRGSKDFYVTNEPGIGPTVAAWKRMDWYRVQKGTYVKQGSVRPDDDRIPQEARETFPKDSGVQVMSTTWWERATGAQDVEWSVVWSPFLWMIHFPVSVGQRIDSTAEGQAVQGMDAGPRITASLRGQVLRLAPIDVCGKVIQAWYVDATLTYSVESGGTTQDAVAIDYDYAIAPQYGGVVVYERFAVPVTQPPLTTIDPQYVPNPDPSTYPPASPAPSTPPWPRRVPPTPIPVGEGTPVPRPAMVIEGTLSHLTPCLNALC